MQSRDLPLIPRQSMQREGHTEDFSTPLRFARNDNQAFTPLPKDIKSSGTLLSTANFGALRIYYCSCGWLAGIDRAGIVANVDCEKETGGTS